MAAPTSADGRTVFYYVAWKAWLFGGMLAAIGLLTVWVGISALNPAWTADVSDGQWLVATPWWVRGPFMLSMALVMLVPGVWQLYAALTHAPVIQCGEHTIAARSSFGRWRRIAWSDIVSIKKEPNQMILSPAGSDTVAAEIWDRRSVLLDIGMLDAAPGEIISLIQQHRPHLAISQGS